MVVQTLFCIFKYAMTFLLMRYRRTCHFVYCWRTVRTVFMNSPVHTDTVPWYFSYKIRLVALNFVASSELILKMKKYPAFPLWLIHDFFRVYWAVFVSDRRTYAMIRSSSSLQWMQRWTKRWVNHSHTLHLPECYPLSKLFFTRCHYPHSYAAKLSLWPAVVKWAHFCFINTLCCLYSNQRCFN